MPPELSHKDPQKTALGRSCVLFVLFCGVLLILGVIEARAEINQKDARKVLQTMFGWSLPGDAVRIQSIRTGGAESAEVTAEIQTVFRLRLNEGRWQLHEIRTAPDRWEQLEVIARATGVELPSGECDAPSQFARSKSDTELTTKRARCLVASLFGVAVPSDDVRIKEISPFDLGIGSEPPALVEA